MLQTIFTVIVPVRIGAQGQLIELLAGLNYKGKAPKADPLGFTELTMLHYASLFLYDDPQDGWQLVFESNIDNDIRSYVNKLVQQIKANNKAPLWLDIFNQCVGFEQGTVDQLALYLEKNSQLPSAAYSGCVGRTRDQILFEADIHKLASETLDALPPDSNASAAASAIKNALKQDKRFIDLYNIPKQTPDGKALLQAQSLAHRPIESATEFGKLTHILKATLRAIPKAYKKDGIKPVADVVLAALEFGVLALYNQIRKEPSASEDHQRPDPALVRMQKQFEDFYPTNHMVSVVHMPTDYSRKWAKQAGFKLLDALARYEYTLGKLGTIPTIHFAHWATVNDDRRLLFVSNFDGSWDSYLDDFTLKAAAGLTLAWAHCKGMPRSICMIWGGAAKGPIFIDWARRSMVPTLVWYNAYPHLSVRNINLNTALRQAIVNDRNGTNAGNWLELIQ